MFIELLMAATLDLSLPEFQPEKDISGNYIELSTDVSTGEVVVNELTQEEFDSSVSENLPVLDSQPADPTREVIYETRTLSTSDNDVVSAIQNFNSDNNDYWEEFLDSYLSNFYIKYNSSKLTLSDSNNFYINYSGKTASMGYSTQVLMYVPVKKGRTYSINSCTLLNGSQNYNIGFVPNLDVGVGYSVIGFIMQPSSFNPIGYSFTSPIDGYFCMSANTDINLQQMVFSVLETQTYRDDVTVIKEITSEYLDSIEQKNRILVFICLMNFCLPFLINGLRLVVGGKDSNV